MLIECASENLNFHRILWIEDNPNYVELFSDAFQKKFFVSQVSSFVELKKMSVPALLNYDAVFLDMTLADGRVGPEVIHFLKDNGVRYPILVLSNDESLRTRIEMLSMGIDDYLWKAMHPDEIELRLTNAISRNQQSKKDLEVNLRGLVLWPHKLQVNLGSIDLDFSKIEFQFLFLLVSRFPTSVTIDELRIDIWKSQKVEVGTINTLVWKLNKKLSNWGCRVTKLGDSILLKNKS